MKDSRQLELKGELILLLYRLQHLPNAKQVSEIWCNYCRKVGVEKIVIYSGFSHDNWTYEQFGCDGQINFRLTICSRAVYAMK